MSNNVTQTSEDNIIRSQDPVLCANNCGFFGNPKTQNYCSKCFSKKQIVETKSELNLSTVSAPTTPMTQSVDSTLSVPALSENSLSSPSSPASSPPISPASPASLTSLASSTPVSLASPASSPASSSAAGDSTKTEQKKKNRCFSCSKKVGVLGFECRCEYVFCGDHRMPQYHNCTYDMKKHNQDQLRKNNPKVQNSKIDKI